jgi:hypothetical protein
MNPGNELQAMKMNRLSSVDEAWNLADFCPNSLAPSRETFFELLETTLKQRALMFAKLTRAVEENILIKDYQRKSDPWYEI